MKTLHFHFIPALGILFALSACSDLTSLAKPEKISVKLTDQTYSVSAGTASIVVSDHFNAKTLAENVNKKTTEAAENEEEGSAKKSALEKIAVYDYWPGGQANLSHTSSATQQFLFHYPVATIPLDFGEYLDKLDLMGALSEALSQKITIPSIGDVGFSQTVNLPDIPSMLAQSFSTGSAQTIQLPGLGADNTVSLSSTDAATLPLTVSSPSFKTMQFSDGVLRLTVTASGSTLTTFTTRVQLLDSKGSVISQSDEVDIHAGGTIDVPLAGKTLVPAMRLALTGSYGGGSLGAVYSYSIAASLSGASISKVTGLTMASSEFGSIGIGSQTISMSSAGSYLQSATISDGGILVFAALPDGWSGVTCASNITVTDSGSLNTQFVDAENDDGISYLLYKYASLAGQTITPSQDVSLGGSLSLALADATLVFDAGSAQTVTLYGALAISGVSRALIDMGELLGDKLDPVTKSKEMSDSVTKFVKEVVFNRIGAAATITTDLPVEELQFGATITSELFGLTGENAISDSVTIASGSTDTLDLISPVDWSCTIVPYEDMEADFTMQLSLAGTDGSSCVSFVNLEFGKEYSLDVSFELAYDWESVTINLAATEGSNLSFSGTKETGLDLQDMLESYLEGEQKNLLDNIALSDELVAYLCVSRPKFEATDDVTSDPLAALPTFTGSVKAYTYSRDENGGDPVRDENPIELVPEGTTLNLIEAKGDYDSLADEDLLITKTLYPKTVAETSDKLYSARMTGLLGILNERPAGLDFEYAIGIGGSEAGTITLTKDGFDSLVTDGYSGSIDVTVDVVFPLEFSIINEGIVIDNVLDLAGQTFEEGEDLFKRDSPDSKISEAFDKYGSIAQEMALSYQLANNTGLAMAATAVLIKDEEGNATLTKDVYVDGKIHTLYLNNDEIAQVLDCYPFQPVIKATISPNKVAIPRNAEFRASAKVSVTFDGTVTVYGDEDEED